MQHFRSRNSWPKWKSSSSVMLLSAENILPFWLKGFWLPKPQAIEIGQAHLINNHSCLEDGMWASTLESLQFILSRIIAQSPSGIDKGYFFFSLTSGWGYLGSKLPPKLWTMSNSKGTFASCHSMILLWEVIRESGMKPISVIEEAHTTTFAWELISQRTKLCSLKWSTTSLVNWFRHLNVGQDTQALSLRATHLRLTVSTRRH